MKTKINPPLPWGKALLFSLLISILCSCSDSAVDGVRAGTINGYPQGTIGDIFEANFDSTDWDSEESGGKRYVTFTGKISEELHKKAIAHKPTLVVLSRQDQDYQNVLKKGAEEIRSRVFKKYNQINAELKQERKTHDFLIKAVEDYGMLKSDGNSVAISELTKHLGPTTVELLDFMNGAYGWNSSKDKQVIMLAEKCFSKEVTSKIKAKIKQNQAFASSSPEPIIKEILQSSVIPKKFPQIAVIEAKLNSFDVNKLNSKVTDEYIPFEKAEFEKFPSSVWPVGSEVKFKWVIHANNEDFEIVEFTNDSWSQQGLDINFILRRVYGDK